MFCDLALLFYYCSLLFRWKVHFSKLQNLHDIQKQLKNSKTVTVYRWHTCGT